MRKHLIPLITATTALLLAFTACGSGNSPSAAPPPTQTVIAVTGVTLNKTSAEISVGGSETLVATVQPWNASNKAVSWASDNTGIATVADGVLTAIAPGTAAITVTTQDGGKTAVCDVTVPEPDTYDTEFALRDALFPICEEISGICEEISGRELTPQEQYEYGQRLEKAYIKGFAKDKYAAHMPFDSTIIAKVFEQVDFRLPYSRHAGSDRRTYATIGSQISLSHFVNTILHEFGHCLGLGESLDELATFEFGEDINYSSLPTLSDFLLNPDSVRTHPLLEQASFTYSPVFDNFLREKVGDTAFWNKVYERSNKAYGEMWDENLTVLDDDNVRRPLVPFDLMKLGKNIDAMPNLHTDFEKFAGFKGYFVARAGEISFLFGKALVGDKAARDEVREFFNLIQEFDKTYNGIISDPSTPRATSSDSIFENARIFDYFKTNTQGKTAGANVDTDAGMER